MKNTYKIYLISDSTGETLDRIFLALKAQFLNIEYKVRSYSFTRTDNQILKILEDAEQNKWHHKNSMDSWVPPKSHSTPPTAWLVGEVLCGAGNVVAILHQDKTFIQALQAALCPKCIESLV